LRLMRRILRFSVGLDIAEKTRVNKTNNIEKKYTAWFSPKNLFGIFPNPFHLVPRPARLIQKWEDDREMARQFLAGVNPVMIQVCKDPTNQLSPKLLEFFQSKKINVQQIAAEKRLLFADYSELATLEKNPHNAYPECYNPTVAFSESNLRYFQASKIVFELGRARQHLDILAIELDMVHDTNDATKRDPQVFSRYTSPKNDWLMAKICVATADSQYHEWVSHLGNTHLTFEPHIIAIHNTLYKHSHPLWDFFEPLTKDTLLLNWAARSTLAKFGPDAFGDRMTSIGTGQFMQLIRNRWEKYDFFQYSALPDELEMRGFDSSFDIPCYLYREDGMKLWKAIGAFTYDFVTEVYGDDENGPAQDEIVQLWAQETTDPGKAAIPGFPTSIATKTELAKVMQTMWWICSGLHAAINFSQYDYFTYVPNKPLGARACMVQYKTDGKGKRRWIFENATPDMARVKETLQVARALTLPSERCIDNLGGHYKDVRYGKSSYDTFLTKLEALGDIIEARNQKNKKQGKAVYSYLHPSQVPSSIDI